jgi:hypothetical protein
MALILRIVHIYGWNVVALENNGFDAFVLLLEKVWLDEVQWEERSCFIMVFGGVKPDSLRLCDEKLWLLNWCQKPKTRQLTVVRWEIMVAGLMLNAWNNTLTVVGWETIAGLVSDAWHVECWITIIYECCVNLKYHCLFFPIATHEHDPANFAFWIKCHFNVDI